MSIKDPTRNHIMPGHTHRGRHIPTGEMCYILGFDPVVRVACVSGWPETLVKFEELEAIEPVRPVTAAEAKRRRLMFGGEYNWI